jgi:PAS domain S-box-containing protein
MKLIHDKENRKIYSVVAIFVFLGISLAGVNYLGSQAESGVRGFISGSAHWAKAQKASTIALYRYINSGDEKDYNFFRESLVIIDGNREAREALTSDTPDPEKAAAGFLKGGNHPDDIPAMIWVSQRFKNFEQIQRAVIIWELGDEIINEKVQLADSVQNLHMTGQITDAGKAGLNAKLTELDNSLTTHEHHFSAAMNEIGRWLSWLVFWSSGVLSLLLIFIAATSVITLMRNYSRANRKLKKSEKKFKNVLEQSRDVIYQINIGSDKYEYMSSSVEDMLGYSARTILEGGPGFILERTHPDDLDRMKEKVEQLETEDVEKILIQDTEFRIKRANGSYIWVNNKRSLLKDEDGNPAAIVGNVRDITVHKRQMEILDKSLVEKQTLLAEIHHRVKNNLAVVSSLVELQKEDVTPEVAEAFQNIQSRIKSIALIHEKLYETTIFSDVDLADYIHELSEIISKTYHSNEKKIDITFELEDVRVDMTTAVPVGLICNELINNSFKHGFKTKLTGEIVIKLRKNCEHVILEVADNGAGLPADFDLANTNGLGVTLLNVLTQQLNGEMNFCSNGQTSFRLQFPLTVNEKPVINSA